MLKIADLSKSFVTGQGRVDAVRGVSFTVARGEIYTLLGPSGCGKSTILRCVAGLEIPLAGDIELKGTPVFSARRRINVPSHERDMGMVFQSYAIWPHLTVFENVAFPLRYGPFKISKSELRVRVMHALKLVQMEGMEERPAPLMSGGQQQRVALARALVYEPAMLLLDEPLSNLDAKLRVEMRVELRALIKKLGLTALYVTHDQEEALTLSDRVSVMGRGKILQEGTPQEIYSSPAHPEVATFVGRTNIFPARVEQSDSAGPLRMAADFGQILCPRDSIAEPLAPGEEVWVGIRPEDVAILREASPASVNTFSATVVQTLFAGSHIQCELAVGKHSCQAEVDASGAVAAGSAVHVQLPPNRLHVFSRRPSGALPTSGSQSGAE